MTSIERLKEVQEVFLKRPAQIYAKVIGPREGEGGLPQEQVHYVVQLMPLEQCYLQEDMELANWPQVMKSAPVDRSGELVGKLAQFSDAATNLSGDDPFFDLEQKINDAIAARAYEIYESREFAHGHDAEDWLLAESEILMNVPADIDETEMQVTVRADVAGFSENDLEVRVAPRSLCISGMRQHWLNQGEEMSVYSERRATLIFRLLDLPSEIDPGRAEASLGDGILEVKLLKVGLRKVVPIRAKTAAA